MREHALEVLSSILDPDVGVNIVDLGLIDMLEVDERSIYLSLIMTSPACPQAGYLADQARGALHAAFPDLSLLVEVEPDVLWDDSRMSQAARQQLGWRQ